MTEKPITYKDSGVDTHKAQSLIQRFATFQKGRPKHPDLLSGIGPYAACLSLGSHIKDMADPLIVTCCDGVGTKLKLALDWENTRGLAQDLVAMNVNDLICIGAKPLAFLDYYASGKLTEAPYLPLLEEIQLACEKVNCAFAGGETAEMPGLYSKNDFDLAGFCVGIVDKQGVIGPSRVKSEDVILGIESSGPHSNGYSLIRKVVEKTNVQPQTATPWNNQTTWSQALLAPTHLYVNAILNVRTRIHACAHITGGGIYENLPRIIPDQLSAILKKDSWPINPLFQWLCQHAGISELEAHSTFNMGIGMILFLDAPQEAAVTEQIQNEGFRVCNLGTVKERKNTPIEWM